MLPSLSEKRLGKRSMRQKILSIVESGTCNVCSAPCSSCMHKLACMGPEGDGFSDENCRVTASQNAIDDDDILSFRNRAYDNLHHATSETSNLVSVNSNHDSLSESAESKAHVKCSDTGDATVESEMLQKLPMGENVAIGQPCAKQQCMLDQKTFPSEYPKAMEGHDDSMSCIDGAHDASTAVNLHTKNVDTKNLSCSPVTPVIVSSVGSDGSGKALITPQSALLETPSNDAEAGINSAKVWSGCMSSTTNGNHMKEDLRLDTSKVSSEIYPKMEKDDKEDSGDQQAGKFKHSNQEKHDEKLHMSDIQEHALQSVSGDDSYESEIMEHDVKVCDICGDAGREDLLAICSKCSDGAEHTYCMGEMLQKVPEGDWLCEECQLAEDTENQKQDAEGTRSSKESTKSLLKRRAEMIEVASAEKRQATETSFGLAKSSSPTRATALIQDSSSKGLDKGKVKVSHQSSFSNNSSMDISENVRSSSVGPRLQTSMGTLLKSNSFNTSNSKSKVKLIDEVPQKKGGRDLDVKEGTARMMSKSVSFRSVNSGCPSATESKSKILSSKFSQAQDVRGLKQAKERNSCENGSFSKLERPLHSSVTNTSVPKVKQKPTLCREAFVVSSSGNSRELKASQSDGKQGSLARSSSSSARKGAEIPANSVRSLSTNGMSNASVEQKLNQVSLKDEPSSSSLTADGLSNDVDDNLLDGLSRSRESSNQSEKTKESSDIRSRAGITTGPKNIHCYKFKEVGNAAEFCSSVGSVASGTYVSAARNAEQDMSKGSKLKAAIEAAMLKKPGIFRKKKESDQSGGLSSSNMDVTAEIVSHHQSHDPLTVSNKTRNLVFDEITSDTVKQPHIHSPDAVVSFKRGDSESVVPSIGKTDRALTTKPLFSKMLTMPEHECIWQGDLEVYRGGKLLDLYSGIQAYLSTCASPKVLEMANQFPHKIAVDKVPRLSTWPRQFHGNGAKENNIALYFFAKDLESYEKSYKSLLDNMIRKDLALKVCFDGVELLIFPSTQLPENSQRWNMLLFIWGVFIGRKSSCTDSIKKQVFPSCNVVPLDINTADKPCSTVDEVPDTQVSVSQMDLEQQNDRLDSKSLTKTVTNNSLLCSEISCAGPSQEFGLSECKLDTEREVFTWAAGTNHGSNWREGTWKHVDDSSVREDLLSIKCCKTGKQDEGVRNVIDGDKMVDRMDIDRDEIKVGRNLNEDPPSIGAESFSVRDETNEGLSCWQSNSRKRSYHPSEEVPQSSSGTTQNFSWVSVYDTVVDGESISKKRKSASSERFWCSSVRDGTSPSDGGASQVTNMGSSSVKEKGWEKPSNEKVIHEDWETTESCFFPVESHHVEDTQMGGNSRHWKEYSSNDENLFHVGVPNLELALGADIKPPNKDTVPFFVGLVEKNNTKNKSQDKVTHIEEEDNVSASLSLSLSFPFPDKEQTVMPVSKTEQLLPERHHVNTSLPPFWGVLR